MPLWQPFFAAVKECMAKELYKHHRMTSPSQVGGCQSYSLGIGTAEEQITACRNRCSGILGVGIYGNLLLTKGFCKATPSARSWRAGGMQPAIAEQEQEQQKQLHFLTFTRPLTGNPWSFRG